jgi:putative peptidoglycan lipid II flippase
MRSRSARRRDRPGDDSRTVVRQSGLTGMAATVAVASGLLLDISVAAKFGASTDTDAFFVAARIPLGLVAILMAVANQALVPTFATWLVRHGADVTHRLSSTVLVGAMAVGAAFAATMVLLAGPVVAAIAPGLDGDQQALAADLVRVMVLMVPLTAGSETFRAYLNARYSFVVPAAMTVVLNVVASTIVVVGPADIHRVPLAYLAGALVQTCVMAAIAARRGFRFRVRLALRAPEVAATGRLSVRPFLAAGLNPAARIVEVVFASFLPPGSVTVLHYGNRLVSAIGGTVLFRSVVVAVMPRLARAHAEGRADDERALTLLGARIMLALALPLMAGVAVLAQPGARALFEIGRFDARSAELLGLALTVYAASFLGSALQRALLAPFFARLDTRTPLRNTLYGVGSNMVLLPLLVVPFAGGRHAVLGVAAAYGLSQYVHVAHAWWRLRAVTGGSMRSLLRPAVRTLAVSAAAAAAMAGVATGLSLYSQPDRTALLVGCGLAAAAGLVVVGLGESGRHGALRDFRRRRATGEGAGRETDPESERADSAKAARPRTVVS